MPASASRPDAHEAEADARVAQVVREPAARGDRDRLVAVGLALVGAAARNYLAAVSGEQRRSVVALVHRGHRASPLPDVADHILDALRRAPLRERADRAQSVCAEVRAALFPRAAPRVDARRVAAARGVLPLIFGGQAISHAVSTRTPGGELIRVVIGDVRDGQLLLARLRA